MAKDMFIEMEDGTKVMVNISENEPGTRGVQEVSGSRSSLKFETFLKSLGGITKGVHNAIKEVQPDKTTVELGLGFAMSTDGLVAKIVDGSTNGSIKVVLEWEKSEWWP